MDELLRSGDISALAGDREKAKALWGKVRTLTIEGIVPRPDALERLRWARGENGTKAWGTENPGRAFAHHMRDQFLGEGEAHRRAMIREFCRDSDHNESHIEFDAYAIWLRKALPKDPNLELLPLVLEGPLSDNRQWQSGLLGYLTSDENFLDPKRTIKAMQILGFLGDTRSFNARPLDQDGKETAMANMISGFRNMSSSNRPALETLKKHLNEWQPHTFGADLVLALLDKDQENVLAAFLTRYKADLTGMNQDRRNQVLGLVIANLKDYPNTEEMDDAIVAALRPLLPEGELKTNKLEEQLADLLSPDKLVEASDLQDTFGGLKFPAAIAAANLVGKIALKHADRAAAGMKKAIALMHESPFQNDPCRPASRKPVAEFLRQLCNKPHMFNICLKEADASGILASDGGNDWLESCIREQFTLIESYDLDKPQEFRIVECYFGTDSIFVGDAANVQPIAIYSRRHPAGSALSEICSQIRTIDSGTGMHLAKNILELLRERKPRTFGLELIELLISSDDKAALDFIRRHSGDLSKIPLSRRPGVLAALRKANNSLKWPDNIDPEIRSILSPLLDLDPAEVERQFQTFISASSLASINHTSQSCVITAQVLLQPLVKIDSGKARDLVRKVDNLLRESDPDITNYVMEWREAAAGIPELFGFVVREMQARGEDITGGWIHEVSYNYHPMASPERAITLLESGFFLCDAFSFRTLAEYDDGSFLNSLIRDIRDIRINPRTKAHVSDYLQQLNPTFGVDLVKTLLEDKAAGLLNFISTHGSELTKMPHEYQYEIVRLTGLRRGSWLALANISGEWREALHDVIPGHKRWVTENCQLQLAAANPDDIASRLKKQDHKGVLKNIFEPFVFYLSEMMLIDPMEGRKAFDKMLAISRKTDKKLEEDWEATIYFLNLCSAYPSLFRPCFAAVNGDNGTEISRCNLLEEIMLNVQASPLDFFNTMDAAGFIADAAKFDGSLSSPLSNDRIIDDDKRKTAPTIFLPQKDLVLYRVLTYLTDSDNTRTRKLIYASLAKHQPRTFGIDMIQAVLDDNPSKTAPIFYKAHEVDFARLPEASRGPVEELLRAAWPDMPKLPGAK